MLRFSIAHLRYYVVRTVFLLQIHYDRCFGSSLVLLYAESVPSLLRLARRNSKSREPLNALHRDDHHYKQLIMFTLATLPSRRLAASSATRRNMSSVLEGDTGKIGTKIHHGLSTGLAVLTPLYMFTPDSMTDGTLSKMFGLLLTVNITAHSWIGLNYVCRDYVPKVRANFIILSTGDNGSADLLSSCWTHV